MTHQQRAHVSTLIFLAACITVGACAPKRTPCDQTLGADACSMVPRRMTCDCTGEVVRAEPRDQPVACGQVRTMCIGNVTDVRDEGDGSPWRAVSRDAVSRDAGAD